MKNEFKICEQRNKMLLKAPNVNGLYTRDRLYNFLNRCSNVAKKYEFMSCEKRIVNYDYFSSRTASPKNVPDKLQDKKNISTGWCQKYLLHLVSKITRLIIL